MGQKFIAHCEETDKKSFKIEVKRDEKFTIVIGPEGDFSLDEVALAESSGYSSISLGDYRLRTETAALLAVFHASIA